MVVALPHSGGVARLRALSGREELLLREAWSFDRALAVDLLKRVVVEGVEVLSATVYEFELMLLALRRGVFGDRIVAAARCNTCGEQVDIEFGATDYLKDRSPRRSRDVSGGQQNGWFRLKDTDIEFRIPTISDQIAAVSTADAAGALAELCVKPSGAARLAARAMEGMAPPVSAPIEGKCPHCGDSIRLMFDVPVFVLRELATQAALVYEDVHLLASRYHWSEERILDLPQDRRREYAEMVREGR